MNDVLKQFLSLSLSGSLLILVLFFCKPFFKDKLSKRWQYYIWLVVVARLLLPFAPETNPIGSAFQSIDHAISQADTVPQASTSNLQNLELSTQTESEVNPQNAPDQISPTKSPPLQDAAELLASNLWLVWLMVAVVVLIRRITIYQSFVRYVRAGQTPVTDTEILDNIALIGEQAGVTRAVELCINPLISSPLLIGFFRPCIVLPSTGLSETDFRYTVLHELTHYRRRDMFYKWLVQITICLHWFNPLVYLMGRELNKLCEFSCDEAIVAKLAANEARDYGKTLLDAMAAVGKYKETLASVTLSENKALLKERLGAIMKFKKNSKWMATITIILTLLFAGGATIIGAYAAPNSSAVSTPKSPWSAMDGTKQSYTYTQAGYYQGTYIFELGWNLNEKFSDSYPDKVKLTLSDLSTVTVSFDKSCQDEAQNQAALSDLKALIEKLKKESFGSSLPLVSPIVSSVEYVGSNDLEKLAEDYYANDKLTKFSAIFPELNNETQRYFCSKIAEDGKVAFLGSTIAKMDADTVQFCAERAYQKDNIAFFSTIVPYLAENQRQTWVARASSDDKNVFLAVLTKAAPTNTESQMTYENGVYFIFCDGAEKKDKPTSSVTGDNIMIVLVKPGDYVSILLDNDSNHLVAEATEQCELMVEKKQITSIDVERVIEAAKQIQRSPQHPSAKGESVESNTTPDLPQKNQTIISAEVDNGGIEIIPVSSDQLTADYDSQYYDVQIKEVNGTWRATVSGKVAKMGLTPFVKLYIPNTGCNITADVLDGSFRYHLPQNFLDSINITAKDASVEITSPNEFENSRISIHATEKDFMRYGHITCPGYSFSETVDDFVFKKGTGANLINVLLTGYTNVDLKSRSD